jgi:hypothetical protein
VGSVGGPIPEGRFKSGEPMHAANQAASMRRWISALHLNESSLASDPPCSKLNMPSRKQTQGVHHHLASRASAKKHLDPCSATSSSGTLARGHRTLPLNGKTHYSAVSSSKLFPGPQFAEFSPTLSKRKAPPWPESWLLLLLTDSGSCSFFSSQNTTQLTAEFVCVEKTSGLLCALASGPVASRLHDLRRL